MVDAIKKGGTKIDLLSYDIACKFGSEERLGETKPVIDALHVVDHHLPCQLQMSIRRHVEAGDSDGVAAERRFASSKRHVKNMRGSR